jgi:magnesium transporter
MDEDELRPVVFETAEEHLTRNVPIVSPDATARQIWDSLVGRRYDCATDVAVCDDGRLRGLVTIERLLSAEPTARAAALMDPDPPAVRPGDDQEIAAWKAVQHDERSIAVVDASGRFVGLIPPRRLLAVLLAEHHEDMARLGGVLAASSPARLSMRESVGRRFARRLPWLLVGLVGVMAAGDLVAAFEAGLRRHLVLAFYLPGVVYLADAVGTQTETLVVRGLSIGTPLGRVVGHEAATGLLIGAALALASVPLTLWRWGSGPVALVVGGSLLAACAVATLIAVSLPWVLHRSGADPAFGSGPLATVIQDLVSILIYFQIAGLVFG